MLRYKPQPAGLEGMAWYCGGCGAELHREVWDSDKTLSQDMYHRTSERFAADTHLRTCKGCGAVHPAPDVRVVPLGRSRQGNRRLVIDAPRAETLRCLQQERGRHRCNAPSRRSAPTMSAACCAPPR